MCELRVAYNCKACLETLERGMCLEWVAQLNHLLRGASCSTPCLYFLGPAQKPEIWAVQAAHPLEGQLFADSAPRPEAQMLTSLTHGQQKPFFDSGEHIMMLLMGLGAAPCRRFRVSRVHTHRHDRSESGSRKVIGAGAHAGVGPPRWSGGLMGALAVQGRCAAAHAS